MSITNDQLKKISLDTITEFSKSEFISSSANKQHYLACISFFKSAVSLTAELDRGIREDFKVKFKEASRQQVIKHKVSDLWGMSLTLAKNTESLLSDIAAMKAGDKLEIAAEFESLFRTTTDTLAAFQNFNNEELKSEEINNLILFVFSMVKPNDISRLTADAVEYLNHLA